MDSRKGRRCLPGKGTTGTATYEMLGDPPPPPSVTKHLLIAFPNTRHRCCRGAGAGRGRGSSGWGAAPVRARSVSRHWIPTLPERGVGPGGTACLCLSPSLPPSFSLSLCPSVPPCPSLSLCWSICPRGKDFNRLDSQRS